MPRKHVLFSSRMRIPISCAVAVLAAAMLIGWLVFKPGAAHARQPLPLLASHAVPCHLTRGCITQTNALMASMLQKRRNAQGHLPTIVGKHAPPAHATPHSSRLRPLTACAANGTWPGPNGAAYLNEFYTGQVDNQGFCTYYVGDNGFTSLEVQSGTAYMEANITVNTGGQVLLDAGTTLANTAGSFSIYGLLGIGNNITVPAFTGNFVVYDSGTLSLGSGDTLTFASHGSAIWANGGVVTMAGTAASPDIITSAQPIPALGDWSGMLFTLGPQSLAGTGELAYVQESYAGYTVSSGGKAYNAGVLSIGTKVGPYLHNVVIDHALNNGIELDGGATDQLASDTITNSSNVAVQYDFPPPDLTSLSNLAASGNATNVIQILGCSSCAALPFGKSGTWPNAGLPYNVLGNINSGGDLTIGQGVHLSIAGNLVAYIAVGYSQEASVTIMQGTTIDFAPAGNYGIESQQGATLNFLGTAQAPVTLTSAAQDPARGDWHGIFFAPGGKGQLAYVNETYAGSLAPGTSYQAGIYLSTSNPSISHTTVSYSAGNGIEMEYNSSAYYPFPTLSSLTSDTILNCLGNAIQYDFAPLDLSNVTNLGASGNGQDMFVVMAGSGATNASQGTGTWPNVGIPYYINGTLYLTGANIANLTIKAGVHIVLNGAIDISNFGVLNIQPGVTLAITPGFHYLSSGGTGGMLNMQGTSDAPIRLTSAAASPSPGDWVGIGFFQGGSGTLTYVNESYAGQTWGYATCCTTSVLVWDLNPTIAHMTITHSLGNDIEVTNGGQPVLRYNNLGPVPPGHYGVVNDGWNSGHPLLDASYCWWGDSAGPITPSNSGGKGVPVSAGVNYKPWGVNGPAITLSKTSGTANTIIGITGSGFQSASREMVNVYLGSQLIGSTRVQFDMSIVNRPLGWINTSVTIPSIPSGTYTLWAIGQDSNRFAVATFTVTATAQSAIPGRGMLGATPGAADRKLPD